MIDTIKLSIPYNDELIEKIRNVGVNVTTSYNSATKEVKFKVGRGDKPLGSFDRNVNLFIREERRELSIELSLPKFIFGHNVFMLYPSEVEFVIYQLWNNLNYVYETEFPKPDTWELLRLDICYNWRFQSQEQAKVLLLHLKNTNFPKKKRGKQVYETGVFHKSGRETAIKFYLKQPEFFAHDYQILKKNPKTIDLAYQFHVWSAGVLRFEVSLKKPYLKRKFPLNSKTYHFATQNDIISALLGNFLSDYIKMVNKKFFTMETALKKLEQLYTPTESRNLLRFWIDVHTQDIATIENILYKGVNKTTLWRKYNSIRIADLGVYSPDDTFADYDLDIPSKFSTNNELISPVAKSAEALGDDDLPNTIVY
jgi:II/X family phage/plasmid replication protein